MWRKILALVLPDTNRVDSEDLARMLDAAEADVAKCRILLGRLIQRGCPCAQNLTEQEREWLSHFTF